MKKLTKRLLTLGLLAAVPALAESWQTDIQKEHRALSKVYVENARMCTIIQSKIIKYKSDMRDDELAQATLKNYERQIKQYCDPILESQK